MRPKQPVLQQPNKKKKRTRKQRKRQKYLQKKLWITNFSPRKKLKLKRRLPHSKLRRKLKLLPWMSSLRWSLSLAQLPSRRKRHRKLKNMLKRKLRRTIRLSRRRLSHSQEKILLRKWLIKQLPLPRLKKLRRKGKLPKQKPLPTKFFRWNRKLSWRLNKRGSNKMS